MEGNNMGWSCTSAAAETERRISEKCHNKTGSQNTYRDGFKSWFYEVSRVEHADGAITGSIWLETSCTRCKKVGTFRIEPDGQVSRGPAWMKKL